MTALRVLNFHDLDHDGACGSYTGGLFERCMRMFHRRGFKAVDLNESSKILTDGGSLSDKVFAITFDDGYRSVYEIAYPLLMELGYTATLFIITGGRSTSRNARLPKFGDNNMLLWSQVEEMQRAGFSIGSHSVSHPDMCGLQTQQLVAEMTVSKLVLQDRLGVNVESLAYPFGRHNTSVRLTAKEHYRYAYTDQLGLIDGKSDRLALQRIDMGYFDRQILINLLPRQVLASYLQVRRMLRLANRIPGLSTATHTRSLN